MTWHNHLLWLHSRQSPLPERKAFDLFGIHLQFHTFRKAFYRLKGLLHIVQIAVYTRQTQFVGNTFYQCGFPYAIIPYDKGYCLPHIYMLDVAYGIGVIGKTLGSLRFYV